MTAVSTCPRPSCATRVEGNVPDCPNCGGKMLTPRAIKARGWIVLVLGLLLAAGMAVLTANLYPLLSQPGVESPAGSRFAGSESDARMILTLFGAVAAFGAAAIVTGGYQAATGKRNMVLTLLMVALAIGLIIYAYVTAETL